MGKKQDLAFGIPNSELLPLESPRQFHEQKFRIGISMNRSLGPKSSNLVTRGRGTAAKHPIKGDCLKTLPQVQYLFFP